MDDYTFYVFLLTISEKDDLELKLQFRQLDNALTGSREWETRSTKRVHNILNISYSVDR